MGGIGDSCGIADARPPQQQSSIANEAHTKALTQLILAGEAPNPISSRDGKLLPLVPRNERLDSIALQRHLTSALATSSSLAREATHVLATGSRKGAQVQHPGTSCSLPGKRCLAAWARSLAYWAAGNARQALKDARFAIAYAPQQGPAVLISPEVAEEVNGAVAGLRCAWAPALLAAAEAHCALAQPLDAVTYALMVLTLEPSDTYTLDLLQQTLDKLPDAARNAMINVPVTTSVPVALIQHVPGGAAGDEEPLLLATDSKGDRALHSQQQLVALIHWRHGHKLQSLPEFQRPKEKYHHYNKWTRGRALLALGLTSPEDSPDGGAEEEAPPSGIPLHGQQLAASCAPPGGNLPQLPEAVMTKLLDMGADDLDLLLKHPVAVAAQVVELLGVWHRGGEQALNSYAIEPPSWEEVQLLQGPGCTGLPLGWNGGADGPDATGSGGSRGQQKQLTGPAALLQQLAGSTGALQQLAGPADGLPQQDLVVSGPLSPASRLRLLLDAVAAGAPVGVDGGGSEVGGTGAEVRCGGAGVTRRELLVSLMS